MPLGWLPATAGEGWDVVAQAGKFSVEAPDMGFWQLVRRLEA